MLSKLAPRTPALSVGARALSMPACAHVPPPTNFDHAQVFADRKKYLAPAITFYKDPLVITDGHMQYLFDEKGTRYLDMFAGIVTVSVGHCHPKVTDAIVEQAKRLVHTTTIYAHPSTAEFAKKIIDSLPPHHDGQPWKVMFVNSGSEANDLAINLVRQKTRSQEFYTVRNAYHGMSPNLQQVTAVPGWRPDVAQGGHFYHIPMPSIYHHKAGEDTAKAALADADDQFACLSTGHVAGWISETVLGVGGAIPLADGFLKGMHERVRARGGLVIADEVQTGFGRTGTHYWGFENQGLQPDVITMAKGMGNGMALAACVGRADVMDQMGGSFFFNTYSGQPMQMAAGIAVMDVIEQQKYQQRCLELGQLLTDGFTQMSKKYPVIGRVGGPGLMLGVEFTKNVETREANPEACLQIWNDLKDKHKILLGGRGYNGSILRIKPPMCITKEDCEYLLYAMEDCIKSL